MAPTVITTVTVPPVTLDLVALATVKDELSITDTSSDAAISRWITASSTEIANYCNRVFPLQTQTDAIYPTRDFHYSTSHGEWPLFQLKNWPPISPLASVVENSVTLTEAVDFLVKYEVGQLFRLDANLYPRRWASLPIVVTYQSGFATIPADVQDAAIRLIKVRYYGRARDPMLRQMQENVPGVYEHSQTFWFAAGPGTGNMPPDVEAILEKYRVPVVG